MKFTFNHFNFNVKDLEKSVAFYEQALDLIVDKRKEPDHGNFILVFMKDTSGTPFSLELTWLKDHPESYDLGEEEYHLAFVVDDFEAAHKKHKEMGCICYENTDMGIYFIADPDGYWLEIIPTR